MKAGGVASWQHWRFWAAAASHLLAWVLTLETGSPRPLDLSGGLMAFCLAFIIVTTAAWQWKTLGDPRQPQNVILHLLFFGSVFFLCLRLQAHTVDHTTILSKVAQIGKWAAGLVGAFPPGVFDVLASPGAALLFVAVCVALSLRRAWAVGCFATLSLAAVGFALFRTDFGARVWFLGGLGCLGLALWLQYNDADERDFWRAVYARWEDDRAPRGDFELKYRLLKCLRRERRPISEPECLAILEKALNLREDDPRLKDTAIRVLKQLVRAEGLVQLHDSAAGKLLVVNPELAITPIDSLGLVAVVPKTALIVVMALVWVVSPIDLIPDAIPVVGLLDDVVVALLSAKVLADSFRWAGACRRRRTVGAASTLTSV